MGFPDGSHGKEFAYSAGDLGSVPGSGIFPGEGNGNPLQDSCLENSMDRGAWLAIVLSQRAGHDWRTNTHTHTHTHTHNEAEVVELPYSPVEDTAEERIVRLREGSCCCELTT